MKRYLDLDILDHPVPALFDEQGQTRHPLTWTEAPSPTEHRSVFYPSAAMAKDDLFHPAPKSHFNMLDSFLPSGPGSLVLVSDLVLRHAREIHNPLCTNDGRF